MNEKCYCGLFVRDCYINAYLSMQEEVVFEKTYIFSMQGLQLLKNDLSMNCDIGIIAYDLRSIYSLLFMERSFFTQQGKKSYVFNTDIMKYTGGGVSSGAVNC